MNEDNKTLRDIALRALLDLQDVMPEYEPSGDRMHRGWKTIQELAEALGEPLDDYWTGGNE